MLCITRCYPRGSLLESMLGSCISTVATSSTVQLRISSAKAMRLSSVQSDRMLRVLQFPAHRRLLRRLDIRRFCTQLEPSTELQEFSPHSCISHDVIRAEGSHRVEAGLETKEKRRTGLTAFRSYFPATRASLGDATFRRFKKDKEVSGRRDLLSTPNYFNRRNIFGDAGVGPFTQVRELGYYSYEQYSDDELGFYDNDVTPQFVDTERWKWRLTQFLRDGKQLEMVSTDKKDRRDYDHIKSLVKQMGLHVQLYTKVLVISKVPLPNYRPDLDDRRPQRLVLCWLLLLSQIGRTVATVIVHVFGVLLSYE